MRSVGRVLFHGMLLALLAATTVYGVVMVVGFLVMIASWASGPVRVPEPSAARMAFGALVVVLWSGLVVAGPTALLRQCRSSHRLGRWVARTGAAPSPALAAAAAGAGSDRRVVEVGSDAPYAFTYGVWRPRVAISSGLVARAGHDELVAVLRHEDYHVHHRDPLKVLALRTWASAFFLIPLIGAVFQRILDRQELKADGAAARWCGVAPVAGALLKATGEPGPAPGAALAAVGGSTLLEARIIQLETGRAPGVLAAIQRGTVLRSLPGAAAVGLYGTLLYQLCITVTACCAI